MRQEKSTRAKRICSKCGKKLERVYYEIMVTYGNWVLLCNKCGSEEKSLQPKKVV